MDGYKALIFDVDGTLAETEEAHRAAFNRAFDDWGLGWHWSMGDYRQLLKTTGGKERMRAYQATLPDGERCLDDAEIARLHADKTAIYTGILASGDLKLRTGVRALIENAAAAGIRLAVATTTCYPNVEALCQCCWGRAADDVFEVIASGDQVQKKKPAPDVFLLALAKLGLEADQCLAFEDSRNGILSALSARLDVVVTPSIYTDDDDLTDARWIVADVEQAHGVVPGLGFWRKHLAAKF